MKKLLFIASVISFSCFASEDALWERGVIIESPRSNIFSMDQGALKDYVTEGQKHAVNYPVTSTELLIPYYPLKNFFEAPAHNPLKKLFVNTVKEIAGMKSFSDFEKWFGLNEFNKTSSTGIYQIPNPNDDKALRMGTTLMQTENGVGFTFSCAACHSNNLFGKSVLGLTNRFPKGNQLFVIAKKVADLYDPLLFRVATNATSGEATMLNHSMKTTKHIGAKQPLLLGLDTSLASVGLSLSKRNQDEYATVTSDSIAHPRLNALEKVPADSKPMPWWNLKYKNRWLSDGSVVSGNPIFTNFLWNEIGRGADLKKLEQWMAENQETMKELTAAVFATEAPRYTDFFAPEKINLEQAKHGEILFNQSCKGCHGVYEKAWNLPESKKLSAQDILATTSVHYPKQTKVIDVGTDPLRYEGMKYFADDLNRLKISKMMGTVIEPQKGYVPPPLVGIWARWPYMHNNSMPSLCAVLTESSKRPQVYYSGPSINPETDFDDECNGYPAPEKAPLGWKTADYLYNTKRAGMTNSGHDQKIFIKDGVEIFSAEDKRDIIQFLKTL